MKTDETLMKKKIFLSPFVVAGLMIQALAGKNGREISSVSAALPCDDKMNIDEDIINYPEKLCVISNKYPHLYLSTIIFPKDQKGTSVTTKFDDSSCAEQMFEEWKYEWLNPLKGAVTVTTGTRTKYINWWTHTHPGQGGIYYNSYNVNPSQTDKDTFKEKTIRPTFGMFIIDGSVANINFDWRVFTFLNLGVKNLISDNQGNWSYGMGPKNIIFEHDQKCSDVEFIGLHLYNLSFIFPDFVDNIVNNNIPEEGWLLTYNDETRHFPNPKKLVEMVAKNTDVPQHQKQIGFQPTTKTNYKERIYIGKGNSEISVKEDVYEDEYRHIHNFRSRKNKKARFR